MRILPEAGELTMMGGGKVLPLADFREMNWTDLGSHGSENT